jgi:hypothetical protein
MGMGLDDVFSFGRGRDERAREVGTPAPEPG